MKSCEKYYLIDGRDSIDDDTYNDLKDRNRLKSIKSALKGFREFKNKISVLKMTSDNAIKFFDDCV